MEVAIKANMLWHAARMEVAPAWGRAGVAAYSQFSGAQKEKAKQVIFAHQRQRPRPRQVDADCRKSGQHDNVDMRH